MRLTQLDDKHRLNTFVSSQDYSQFLQSAYWQNINTVSGNRSKVLAVIGSTGKVLLTCLLIEHSYRYFTYYFAPRGPILSDEYKEDKEIKKQIFKFFYREAKKLLNTNKVWFWRIEPIFSLPKTKTISFKRSLDLQPKKTRVLDLYKSQEELLSDMHAKTRYNIRLAKKKKVEVFEAQKGDLDLFINLLDITSKRNRFSLHQRAHYRHIFHNSQGKIKLLLAKHENDIISGAMFSFFGDTATYLHGASGNKKRNLMAPYLIQWQAINLAKDKQYKYYDFGGIDEKKWPGVSRFKAGFGGRELKLPGTFDIVFKNFKYNTYKVLRKIRRSL